MSTPEYHHTGGACSLSVYPNIDEELLAHLDASDEVRSEGRSAVLRRAAREYLRRRQQAAIREGYRRASGEEAGLGEEFAGWEDEGAWPAPFRLHM